MSTADTASFRKAYDGDVGYFITHPNGQKSHYHLDSYVDPWLPVSEKPAIMFNHGFARTSEMWYHWVPPLARHFVVIRRDSRGQGKSSYPKRISPWSDLEQGKYEGDYKYNIEVILEEIIDMLDQLGVRKVIFFGEATSGEVGHAIAAKYPDRIAALITCSSPSYLPSSAVTMFSHGEKSWPEAIMKLGTRGWNEALAKNPGTLPLHDKAYTEWLLTEAGKTTSEGLAGYAIFLTHLDSRSFIKDIKCPYLILAPSNSAAVPPSESAWQATQAQQAELVNIQASGHEIFVEAADACIEATLHFLKKHGFMKQM